MIKSVTVVNHLGESLKITLKEAVPKHGLLISDIDGIGPVKSSINKTDLASNDGSIVNSTRLGTRSVTFTIIFSDSSSIENPRQLTYKYFPIKREITLLFETDNRSIYCSGFVESNEPDIFSKREQAKITVLCSDPYFYENSISTSTFSDVVPKFEFPFSEEIEHIDFNDIYIYTINGNIMTITGIDVTYALGTGIPVIEIPDHIDGKQVKLG